MVLLDDLGVHIRQPEEDRQESNDQTSEHYRKGDSGLRQLIKIELGSTLVD